MIEGRTRLRDIGILYRSALYPLSDDGIEIDQVLGAANYRPLRKMKIRERTSFERNGFNSGVFGLHAFRPVNDRIRLIPLSLCRDLACMTSSCHGVAVQSWALLPLSLEIGISGFWETGGEILRLGFEIQKFPPAACPP